MKYFLQRFPASPHPVRETMRVVEKIVLERLEGILPQATWSNQDTTGAIEAIDSSGAIAILNPKDPIFETWHDLIGHIGTTNYTLSRNTRF